MTAKPQDDGSVLTSITCEQSGCKDTEFCANPSKLVGDKLYNWCECQPRPADQEMIRRAGEPHDLKQACQAAGAEVR